MRKPVLVALVAVIGVVVVTAVFNGLNGGLGHTGYIAGLWTAIAVIGLALYYSARRVIQRVRR